MKFSIMKDFSLGKFIVEVSTIIFGVILALGVNEVREHYNDEEIVNTALESIQIEIQKNRDFLNIRIPYYSAMIDTLDILIKKHGANEGLWSVSVPGFTGINPPMLRNSSLQTAISTQAFSNMDYAVADNISWVYSYQETYLKWVYIYFDAFVKKDKVTIKMLQNLFKEMASVGKQLNVNYAELLNDLKEM